MVELRLQANKLWMVGLRQYANKPWMVGLRPWAKKPWMRVLYLLLLCGVFWENSLSFGLRFDFMVSDTSDDEVR